MKNDNVIYLNQDNATDEERNENSAEKKAKGLFGLAIGGLAYILIAGMRQITFLILFWIRGPIRYVLGAASFAALITAVIMFFGYNGEGKTEMTTAVAGAGFMAFVIMWMYDSLILALSPEPLFLG